MGFPREPCASICWNGLCLDIPRQWEVMVHGPQHLIAEYNLEPVLELRWHRHEPGAAKNRQSKLRGYLQQEAGGLLQQATLPESFKKLSPSCSIELFTSKDGEEKLAQLSCSSCPTTILLRFFPAATAWLAPENAPCLALNCHPQVDGALPWRIQDISFRLPVEFSLASHSFSLGLSRLSFTSPSTDIRLCRLAPASRHLERSSLTELFTAFSSGPSDRCIQIDQDTLLYEHDPGKMERLGALLRRRKPYVWSRFEYVAQRDRILGIHLAANRRLPEHLLEMIRNSYVLST